MEHEVTIKIGKHRHPNKVPTGAQKILEKLLSFSDFSEHYTFKILFGERVPGSAASKAIEVKALDERRGTIVVACKTGDNGTRHKYYIPRPERYKGTLQNFFYALIKGEEKMKEEENKVEERFVFEDLGTTTKKIGAEEIAMPDSTEKTGIPEEKTERRTPDKTREKRIVADVLDEELIKFILHEMGETGEMKQNEFRKKIESLALNCCSKRIIIFLKKKDYIKGKLLNRTRAMVFLTKKGRELVITKAKPAIPKEMLSPNKNVFEEISAEQTSHQAPILKEASKLELLARELNSVKSELEMASIRYEAAEEKVTRAKIELAAEREKMEAIGGKIKDIKEQMIVLMD